MGNRNSTDAVGACEIIGYEGGASLVDVDWEVLVNGDEYIQSTKTVAEDRRLPNRSASANSANHTVARSSGANRLGDGASPWAAPTVFDPADEDTVSFPGPMDPPLPVPPPSISVATLRNAQDEASRERADSEPAAVEEVSARRSETSITHPDSESTPTPKDLARNRVHSLASGLVTVSKADGASAARGSATRVRSARSVSSAVPPGSARDAARAVLSAAGIEPVMRVQAVPIAEIRERGQRSRAASVADPTLAGTDGARGGDASRIRSLVQTPLTEGSVAPRPEVHREAAVDEAGHQTVGHQTVAASTATTRTWSSHRNNLLLLSLFVGPIVIAVLVLVLVRTGQVDLGTLPFTASAASMIEPPILSS